LGWIYTEWSINGRGKVERWKGGKVERWNGGMVERFPKKQVHQVIFCVIPGKRTLDPGSSLLETPVERWKWRFSDRQYKVAALAIAPSGIAFHGGGGKVRLPQRPEVSSKQATPLPLPNRLRQPNPVSICVNLLTRDPVFSRLKQAHSPETTPSKLHAAPSRPATRDPVF